MLRSRTVASGNRQGPGGPDPKSSSGATEPITLTDPDGAVTRVAPWSSWTREQVRAPGGEPALVTRLTQGQLWFSAGRRRSPWRHEVHVGPAIVSTPRGRFQAVAEADGGATISCLAGRTRVVAGLREPVLLGPDQSAAVSSDGRTLVVMDRATTGVGSTPDLIDLTDDVDLDLTVEEAAPAAAAEVPELAAVGATEPATAAIGGRGLPDAPPPVDGDPAVDAEPDAAAPEGERPARLGWVPELVAVLALVTVLVAVVWLFVSGDDVETAAPPTTRPAPIEDVTPTTGDVEIGEPATTTVATTAATTAPTTAPTTVTTLPPLAAGASASGALSGCRRAEGGVTATVEVTHRGGPASSFDVTAALVDASGTSFAEGTQRSPLIQPGAAVSVDVLVPFTGRAEGSCELVSVTGG